MTLTRTPRRACSGVMLWALPFLYLLVRKGVVVAWSFAPCLPTGLYIALLVMGGAALCRKAQEGLRANEVHPSFLGAVPKHTHLPVLGLLMAVLTVCQVPKLSACLGTRDGLPGIV